MIFDRFRKKKTEPAPVLVPKEPIWRELYLIRHADALDDFLNGDLGRPLSDKGLIQAKKTGQYLNKNNVIPDGIIHSGAVRTKHTAETVALAFAKDIPLIEEPVLYNVTSDQWVDFIHGLDNDLKVVIAVGHNFGISDFASYVNGATLERLENAAVYGFQLELDAWGELKRGDGELVIQYRPF